MRSGPAVMIIGRERLDGWCDGGAGFASSRPHCIMSLMEMEIEVNTLEASDGKKLSESSM